MTLKQLREKLSADTYSLKNGIFTVRRGFFYTGGRTSEDFAQAVSAALPSATIVEHGEVWKAFRGGASTAQQSHWFVKFQVKE
jgi:hypothetical protein